MPLVRSPAWFHAGHAQLTHPPNSVLPEAMPHTQTFARQKGLTRHATYRSLNECLCFHWLRKLKGTHRREHEGQCCPTHNQPGATVEQLENDRIARQKPSFW
eukprot:641087-Rhodomonas_salina.2